MKRNEQIIKMYTSGSSVTMIAEILNVGRKTVYRVLSKNNIDLHIKKKKICVLCGKESIKNLCGTCNTNLRRYRVKKRSVEYKGGKCENCGWSGHLSGYDFHHKDSNDKNFNPSAMNLANRPWEAVKKELDKCQLLCALCHREIHSKYDELIDIEKEYKGKEFKG